MSETSLALGRRFRDRCHMLLTIFLLATVMTFGPPPVRGQQAGLPKLTLSQLEGLIVHGVPDSTLSTQIARRGISFTPTPAILNELRAKGAGPLTLAGIEAARASASKTRNTLSEGRAESVRPERDWRQDSPFPLQPGTSLNELRTDEIWMAGQSGISSERDFGGNAAVFSAANSSHLDYAPYISDQGTLELWIKVDRGYSYNNFRFMDNQDQALVFSSDCEGGDVTWPGATKLWLKANGDIVLEMATSKYNAQPAQKTVAEGTSFRFGEWHAIGISYGSEGQWIMLDGRIVAASPSYTQRLGRAGNHQQPVDQIDVGETPCGFWRPHQYDGGFDGVVAGVRLSRRQRDWALALTQPQSEESNGISPRPQIPIRGVQPAVIKTQSTTQGPVRISAGVAEGMLAQKTDPIYPPIARAARISGKVVLQAEISKTGVVEELHVVSGPAMLQHSALDAVRNWRYRPYLLNNQPVEVQTTIDVTFTLNR